MSDYVAVVKVTLDLHNTSEKFGGFLRAALDVLSQLLELATLHDIGKVRLLACWNMAGFFNVNLITVCSQEKKCVYLS